MMKTKTPLLALKVLITLDASGIQCSAMAGGVSAYEDTELNTMAIGALEIAKASLLARRWGINVGGLTPGPLVGPKKRARRTPQPTDSPAP